MQGSLTNNGMKDVTGLSDSNRIALDEIKLNGPLHLDHIPIEYCPKKGFTVDDVEALIDRGVVTRISVKGNSSFVAAIEGKRAN